MLPVVDEMYSWGNHLDALELVSDPPHVVVDTKLSLFWYIQEGQDSAIAEQHLYHSKTGCTYFLFSVPKR